MNADRAFGLDYVCVRWHSGQWSRGYRVHCKLRVSHGMGTSDRLLPRGEWEDARIWAAHYTRLARRNPRMF